MDNQKKNSIKVSIENDAPFGDIPYYNISFLTANKLEKLASWYPVRGFKVHNGYSNREQAETDAKNIKTVNDNHDIFVSEMGHVYGWDDATRSEGIDYQNDKLNELEKKRRENIDQSALMREQFKNELTINLTNNNPTESIQNRLRNKLLERGQISKQEYELAQKYNTTTSNVRSIATEIDKIKTEVMNLTEDYLDENAPTGLKFGCLTIYSPSRVIGLSTYCFKIRGLFDSKSELDKRIRKLKAAYPNDRIYAFEVGKWCALPESEDLERPDAYLNYLMKAHLDQIVIDNEDFEKRKNDGIKKNEDAAKLQLLENRQKKRAEARKQKKQAKLAKQNGTDVSTSALPTESDESPISTDNIINEADRSDIQEIASFLDDPELRNRYGKNTNPNPERMEINL